MSEDLFSQQPGQKPTDLHLPTKGCHFPYEVFEANGFEGEWIGEDALCVRLQNNFMHKKDGRYYVCGDDVPLYLSGITKLPETITARDVTAIVQEFRKALA